MKTEIKVGLFVFISFLLILFSIAYLGRSSFSSEGKEYYLTFKFLNDLKPGADVKFAGGILVGYVKEVKPYKTKVRVKIWVKKDFELTANARFFIMGEGFLGEKYLNISFLDENEDGGQENPPPLKENDTVAGVDTVSFGEVLKDIYTLTSKMTETVDNINFMLGGMTRRKDLDRISRYTVRLLQDTSKIVENNKQNISDLLKEMMQGIRSFNNILNKELPRIMRNSNQSLISMTRDVTGLIRQVKYLLLQVRQGKGLVGKVIMDKKLARAMEQVVLNLNKLSEKLLSTKIFSPESRREKDYSWRKR